MIDQFITEFRKALRTKGEIYHYDHVEAAIASAVNDAKAAIGCVTDETGDGFVETLMAGAVNPTVQSTEPIAARDTASDHEKPEMKSEDHEDSE